MLSDLEIKDLILSMPLTHLLELLKERTEIIDVSVCTNDDAKRMENYYRQEIENVG